MLKEVIKILKQNEKKKPEMLNLHKSTNSSVKANQKPKMKKFIKKKIQLPIQRNAT